MRRLAAASAFAVALAACGSSAPDGASSTPTSASSDDATSAPTSEPATPTTDPGPASPAGIAPSPGVERAIPAPDAPTAELAAGFNDAGFDLLRSLDAGDNVVFSPASIGHALLMASAAGDDATLAAIETAFALPADAHAAWNAIDRAIADATSDQVEITISDRIWPRLDVTPDQEWVDLLAAQHGADVVPLDFAGDQPGSRETINGWVGERTDGLIPDLLPEGFIQPQTVLVLTDAVYFAADWETPFGKYGPVAGTFTTLDGSEREVEFMQELELGDRRGAADGVVGAEIPYAGGDFSMLVLVPDEGTFTEFVAGLDQSVLDEVDAGFTTGPYELLLPTWTDDEQIDLLPWLDELGIAPGSFPAISPDAFLDAAVHGADIAVDENGTVAAAATALGFAESGPPEPELTVAADRPFVYVIRHRPSGLVLFAGQVTDPT